jgi:hypothetical protein
MSVFLEGSLAEGSLSILALAQNGSHIAVE